MWYLFLILRPKVFSAEMMVVMLLSFILSSQKVNAGYQCCISCLHFEATYIRNLNYLRDKKPQVHLFNSDLNFGFSEMKKMAISIRNIYKKFYLSVSNFNY